MVRGRRPPVVQRAGGRGRSAAAPAARRARRTLPRPAAGARGPAAAHRHAPHTRRRHRVRRHRRAAVSAGRRNRGPGDHRSRPGRPARRDGGQPRDGRDRGGRRRTARAARRGRRDRRGRRGTRLPPHPPRLGRTAPRARPVPDRSHDGQLARTARGPPARRGGRRRVVRRMDPVEPYARPPHADRAALDGGPRVPRRRAGPRDRRHRPVRRGRPRPRQPAGLRRRTARRLGPAAGHGPLRPRR